HLLRLRGQTVLDRRADLGRSLSRNSEFFLPNGFPEDGILTRHDRRDWDLDLASRDHRARWRWSCNHFVSSTPARPAQRHPDSERKCSLVRKFRCILFRVLKRSVEEPLLVSLLDQRLHATRSARYSHVEVALRTLSAALQESRRDARSTGSPVLSMRMFRVV